MARGRRFVWLDRCLRYFYRVDPQQGLTIILMTKMQSNQTDIRDKFWHEIYKVCSRAGGRFAELAAISRSAAQHAPDGRRLGCVTEFFYYGKTMVCVETVVFRI